MTEGVESRSMEGQRRLILRCRQSPGDVVMLTAAVRDLHLAHPGKFLTDVRTTADQLWEQNPYLVKLEEDDASVEVIDVEYPLIHQSNERPYHFIHGFIQFLESQLQLSIPVTAFKGDVHLSDEEKKWTSQVAEAGYDGPFWLIVAGGKFDFTAKWWNPSAYQRVVDHFHGRVPFVQVGEADHWHQPLRNVLDLRAKTDIRQFLRLMYHADGVLCPVTFAMHLAAAVEMRPEQPRNRACVVVAGGREPMQWEAYPHHQYLSTNGALWCCDQGGCWKSRCQPVGDGDGKDNDRCLQPVLVSADLQIARCMEMIRPEDVIRRIELYYEGHALQYATTQQWDTFEEVIIRDAEVRGA
ncbi:MAG: ADP-heptose:LPS heptosyltransferase-like protein [Schlesneria sp.]|nr:ADP-heptose:LPS heptosyltransferase-like protein [Schlesneria sp.]